MRGGGDDTGSVGPSALVPCFPAQEHSLPRLWFLRYRVGQEDAAALRPSQATTT